MLQHPFSKLVPIKSRVSRDVFIKCGKQERILVLASLSMAIAVILGALGAHKLQDLINPQQLQSFETGIRFQIYHSLALLLLGLFPGNFAEKLIRVSINLMILGMVLFSFSIYLLSLKDILHIGEFASVIGPVTPIGGVLLITSWIVLSIGLYRSH